MKIGILSHPATWTTGFGITCNKIATGLSKAGHEVVCAGFSFGIISVAKNEQINLPYRIWNGNGEVKEVDAIENFLKEEQPDAILLNYDIAAAVYFISLLKIHHYDKKLYAHIVLDGFPASVRFIEAIKELDGVVVPTEASRKYLVSAGLNNVRYAPHGVDTEEFFPLDKKHIRDRLNIGKKLDRYFIIGVFAKNDERKQIPKILLALHHLVVKLKQKKVLLYVHSETKPRVGTGWDLESIATNLKITDHVLFTEREFIPQIGIKLGNEKNEQGIKHRSLTYLERINMCDVIVNVPFSGGFELCNVEAQACGVPLITIDDNGNIKEVVQDSALLIQPRLTNIWTNGAVIHLIDEKELAGEILNLKNDRDLRSSLKQKGFNNIKRYPWSYLETQIERMIRPAKPGKMKPPLSSALIENAL